ncbi:MAG: STAS domain-containing protein [Bryobacteraceae bacterium]
MALKFEVRRSLDVTIMDLDGRLSLGEGSLVFHEAVRDLVWEGHKKLVLENSGLSYFDSSGVGELVSAFTTIRNRGGELVLAALSRKLSDFLRLTKLYTVYPVFVDVDEALRYFDDRRSTPVQVWRRSYGGVLVLEIAGALTPENGCAAVEEAINSAAAGCNHMICLCTQLLGASPEGCAMLARAAAALRERDGELVLANVEARLDEALRPCQEARIRRFPALDPALAAFGTVIAVRDRLN